MSYPLWTLGLIGAGLVSLPAVIQAEESSTPSSVLTSLSATTLSGYVDTSAQWNLGTGNTFVPSYAYGGTGKADGFNLNAVKVTLEKPLVQSDLWGAGYKVDLFAGPDANLLANQSTGVAADFAVRQAYVLLHAPLGNGLDFKLGVWDPIMGYEVTDAPYNPNFTRSYGYTIEPVNHTGALATYQVADFLSASVGVADTFGPRINERANPPKAESYKAYMGSVTFTAPTNWGVLSGSTVTGTIMNGFNSTLGGGVGDETSYYVGATMNTPVSGLKVGAAYDYLGVSQQPLRGAGYANAAGLYLAYQATEKLSFYGRAEYASSDLGASGPGTSAPLLTSRIIETTATIQYDLWKNVLSRVEFRWDHSASGTAVYGNPGALKDNSYILLADIAYKF